MIVFVTILSLQLTYLVVVLQRIIVCRDRYNDWFWLAYLIWNSWNLVKYNCDCLYNVTQPGSYLAWCDANDTSWTVYLLVPANNGFVGSIPKELGLLTQLEGLWLESNLLTATIPSELGTATNLRFLSLSNNTLTGTIPTSLQRLSNLEELGLQRNKLSKAIPPELSVMTNLKSLYLQFNELTGPIPSQVASLSSLQRCMLRGNALSGKIPPLGSLQNPTHLHLQNNSLTGEPPPELFQIRSLRQLYLQHNDLTGNINSLYCDPLTNFKLVDKSFRWRPKHYAFRFRADCAGNDPPILCECCSNCYWQYNCTSKVFW